MYVNAAAYQSVHVFEIAGPGDFSLIQRYDYVDFPQGATSSMGISVSDPLYRQISSGSWFL